MHSFVVTVFILVVLLFPLGCDEALPPYETPKALVGEITFQYVFQPDENGFRFYATARNISDETFQDTIAVEGTLIATLSRDKSFRKTFNITMASYYLPASYLDSLNSGTYDPRTGMFTIDPGKKIDFLFRWDFIDDNTRDIRTYAFTYAPDPLCPSSRMRSNTETLTLQGSLRVTKNSGQIFLGPREVQAFYVAPYIVGRMCPSY
jgi:hypothetical protein